MKEGCSNPVRETTENSKVQSRDMRIENGRPGEEEEEKEKEERDMAKPVKLFLGGLSLQATSQSVVEYFERFGEITNVRVPPNKILPGKSRGFGFVTFKDHLVAERVMQQTEHKICGRHVDVKYAVQNSPLPVSHSSHRRYSESTQASETGRRENQSCLSEASHSEEPESPIVRPASRTSTATMQTLDTAERRGMDSTSASIVSTSSCATETEFQAKVFVGGLAAAVSSETLRAYFATFGQVLSAIVMIDRETNRSRGFGFVVFEDQDSLKRALKVADHTIMGKRVEVKVAIPKDILDQHQTPDFGPQTAPYHHQFHAQQHHSAIHAPAASYPPVYFVYTAPPHIPAVVGPSSVHAPAHVAAYNYYAWPHHAYLQNSVPEEGVRFSVGYPHAHETHYISPTPAPSPRNG